MKSKKHAILVLVLVLGCSWAGSLLAQGSPAEPPPPRAIATEPPAWLKKRMEEQRRAEAQNSAAQSEDKSARPASPPPAESSKQAKGKAAKPEPRAEATAATAALIEPTVVTKLEKCLECKTTAKRRIAILPARIGTVAGDAGASPESLAQVVADHMESVLKDRPGLLVLGRGDLAAVLGEQELVSKGVTQSELGPQRGRVIPAEILLRITLDRVDVKQSSRRVTSSNSASLLERAQELERQALADQEAAMEAEKSALDNARMSAQMKAQNEQLMAQMRNSAQQGTLSRGAANLGALGAMLGKYAEDSTQRQSESDVREAQERRINAQRKLLAARQQREQAERRARTDIAETRTTTATINVVWRAVDSLTGELIAGDSHKLTDSLEDRRNLQADGSNSTDTAETNRAQGLVHKLIDKSLETMAERISGDLGKAPFRAQIVKVDKSGVIVNVGRNLDVEVGDTFAVKRIDTSLIDPATGQSLAGPGTLEGLIRVVEVSDRTAKAVVMQTAGKLARGDNLEWVGIYK